MIINPKFIVEKGILTIENSEQIQQNGIDLTIGEIRKIIPGENILTKNERQHTQREELQFDEEECVVLTPGKYDILFGEKINLPNGICSYVVSRSTLNRGGNFITSGWYDAGFSGPMGGVLHITEGTLKIQKGVRIAQMVFFKAEEGDTYNGIYNTTTTA